MSSRPRQGIQSIYPGLSVFTGPELRNGYWKRSDVSAAANAARSMLRSR